MRGATSTSQISCTCQTISIHAPHARSDGRIAAPLVHGRISIHAPHARSDAHRHPSRGSTACISIHAPHARSDFVLLIARPVQVISIHAPHARSDGISKNPDILRQISIHAPHARSDSQPIDSHEILIISIHAPHARSDCHSSRILPRSLTFQSTLLMRGATRDILDASRKAYGFQSTLLMRGATSPRLSSRRRKAISIHAPHARSDTS